MKKYSFLLLVLIFGIVVSAQMIVTPPSTDYQVTWSHNGVNVDHYEVRMSATDAWVSVGKPVVLQKTLAVLPAGSYGAQVRACAAGNVCSAPGTAAAFTIPAPVVTQVPSVPGNISIGRVTAVAPTTCAPASQSVTTGQTAAFTVTGSAPFSWSAAGGNIATGSGTSFSTNYATVGTKTVTATGATGLASTCSVVVSAVVVPPTGNLLFSSSWDNAALGCGPQLLDGVWADYGGSTACNGTVHDADIVAGVSKTGNNSLRITQKVGVSTTGEIYNGTDFRIQSKNFGAQSELTAMTWVRYDSNYHWASADHKIFLLMGGDSQNVYINYRGGADPTHARLCVYPLANDTFFCQTNAPFVTVNQWFRIRVHVITGTHGSVEVFLTPDGQAETKLTLVRDAGTGATVITDVNTGSVDNLKLDTTYNAGSMITQNMFQWYDGVSVYSGLVQ